MEISINLAPSHIKEQIIKANHLRLVLRLGLIMVLILVSFYVFLFGLGKILEYDLSSVMVGQKTGSSAGKYDRINNLEKEFSETNDNVGSIMKIKNDQLYWSDLFVRLSKNISSGIEITGVTTKDYIVSVSGNADNRDSLTAFEEKLKKEDCFQDVNLPLSFLVSPENSVFQIDLKMKEECLKKK